MKIYIAGPDVFEKNAAEIGMKYKEICSLYGHEGLYPLDNDCDSSKDIYLGNIALIDSVVKWMWVQPLKWAMPQQRVRKS